MIIIIQNQADNNNRGRCRCRCYWFRLLLLLLHCTLLVKAQPPLLTNITTPAPILYPSTWPSVTPFISVYVYAQEFLRTVAQPSLNGTEKETVEAVIASLTPLYAPSPSSPLLVTICSITQQNVIDGSDTSTSSGAGAGAGAEQMMRVNTPNEPKILQLVYELKHSSHSSQDYVNLDNNYKEFMNLQNGTETLLDRLNDAGIEVNKVEPIERIISEPSATPSFDFPSSSPTTTTNPTFFFTRTISREFLQKFERTKFVGNPDEAPLFSEEEKLGIQNAIDSLTPLYGQKTDLVKSSTEISSQQGIKPLNQADPWSINVRYEVTFKSNYTEVFNYPSNYTAYMNNNLQNFRVLLESEYNVEVDEVFVAEGLTTVPPVSTESPSMAPGNVLLPSAFPTVEPSIKPSLLTTSPTTTASLNIGVIAGAAGGALLVLMIGVILCYRRKRKLKHELLGNDSVSEIGSTFNKHGVSIRDPSLSMPYTGYDFDHDMSSLVSPKSLLSLGNGSNGFGAVNENVSSFDDPLWESSNEEPSSTALNKALANDEATRSFVSGIFEDLGDDANLEPDVLSEVFEWIKRNINATIEAKYDFLREVMNAMVACVRYGQLTAPDACKIVHECTVLLELPVVEQISETTLIVSGLRKTTTVENIKIPFQEFGDVEYAGIASNEKGFGIVRFRRPKEARAVMEWLEAGEIIEVDEVSIVAKLLRAPPQE